MTEFEHNFDWLVGEIDKAKEKARALFSKSLALPKEAPAEHKLVAIDNNNAQELIGIGSGLMLDNGVLKTSGGSATPIVITTDESANTYTMTGGTLATLLTDFETKTVLVKSLLAFADDTAKAIGVANVFGGGVKISYVLPSNGGIFTYTLNPDGTYA